MDASDGTPNPQRRAGASHLLKVAAALGVLVLAGVLLARDPLEQVDARAVLAKHFAVQELPFGFRVGEARQLATAEVVVALESDDERAAEAVADDDANESDAAPSPDATEVEDTAESRERHALEDGTPPSKVYLVRYPTHRAKSVLDEQLKRHVEDVNQPPAALSDEPKRVGNLKLTIEGGRLPWGAYDADFVLERKYEDGGHFADVARVNLTRGQQCWILIAIWPRDYRGATEPVERLLESLPPL